MLISVGNTAFIGSDLDGTIFVPATIVNMKKNTTAERWPPTPPLIVKITRGKILASC